MFNDARTVAKGTLVDTDICIVGAGAAGISIAREFAGQSIRVCLLESGGLDYDVETQALYRGPIAGRPYFPLDVCRLRFFGGTTNHWSGTSRPFDPVDFKARSWVPHSGWPFDASELDPFYRRAQAILELGPYAYAGKDWETEERPLARFEGGALTHGVLQKSPPTRFGKVYRQEIERAPNIATYLFANVLEIETNRSGRAVTRLRVASLERNDFFVSAKIFVLATGGIENARLLLLSNKTNRNGLGNDHGNVGRFFMEHPLAKWGLNTGLVAPSGFPTEFYKERNSGELIQDGKKGQAIFWGFIGFSEETQRREELLNCGLAIRAIRQPAPPPGVDSARQLKNSLDNFWHHVGNIVSDLGSVTMHSLEKLLGQEDQPTMLEIQYWAEPEPNPDSRILLTREQDALGQYKAALQWRLTKRDYGNLQKALQLLGIEFGRSGLGRVGVNSAVYTDPEALFEGSYHHMGTTRIHKDPKQGVVDANCRVHQVSNLYVAGSSTFPTGGHANPTMTLVALALRLADHIKTDMKHQT